MTTQTEQWLLECDEPWTRYRTLVDLLARPDDDVEVQDARAAILAHPQVQRLVTEASGWPGRPLKRHNDASHLIYRLSTLADFGVRADDPGMLAATEALLAHQSEEGAFQSVMNVPKAFGGTGQDHWAWMACDAPTILYALLAMGLGGDAHVRRAVDQ
ncbi:MAG: hypothetical protein JSW37_03820, partial [Anaerolineales bacterium]